MKISVAAPIELALNLFVMNPEGIRGNYRNTSGFHPKQFRTPSVLWYTCKMYLAHYRYDALIIEHQTFRIQRPRLPLRIDSATHVKLRLCVYA
jgi:hypothetical protein